MKNIPKKIKPKSTNTNNRTIQYCPSINHNTLWPISIKYIIYTRFSHLICGFSATYIAKGDPVSSLCRFLLSSPLQWWVCSGLWVLVRISVRGFWFCCGSALEVYEFSFCGFCFESLVLGLVLAWITGFRFWFESLGVLVWITDSRFIGGGWLQSSGFVYWCRCRCFVDGFVPFVDGLWLVVHGR